ncbi:exopolysaccharide biosynthesis protein [Serinibacter arcticus]|uniref:Exopolysaccharide biosynthesis protein n=1 Tax=Serinibacter arcticus TaxID=1655435 RepID=A0A2U1ZRS0_9MICO|nr:phosphodiester glycosidase family protein [Serinibacter arcticus]PWD49689.1 exopolysaccharide biosynthesis protein [Serinibacter arcticus]
MSRHHSPGPARPSDAPRRRRRLRRSVAVGALALTTALTGGAAWALDRFVIEHVEIADVSAVEEQDVEAVSVPDGAEPQVTITSGTVGEGEDAATYYVADLVLDDITQLRSAFADDAFGENIVELPSVIAESVGASLAVNGDYYGFRSTGIMIRNGVAYRDEAAREGLAINADGTLELYDETTTSAQQLVDDGVWQTLSFGPGLVDDGEVVAGIDQVEIDTNVGNHSIQGDQPRTAIGMIEADHLILVVVDGRSDESAGVTLPELARLMADLGATEAYNLDGGGSSTMVADGDLVNDPLGRGSERGTSDILYVG